MNGRRFPAPVPKMTRPTPAHRLIERLVIVGCLAIVSSLFLLGVCDGSWPIGHEERIRYLALGEQFRTTLLETGRYPRWLPDMYGGYGYPTFVFYQPLIFFLYSVWSLALTGTWAMLASLWTLLFASLTGVYLLARTYGSRLWALVVVLVFALSPYLLVDLFVRQALSEFAATLLFPWVLYSLVQLQIRVSSGRALQPGLALVGVSSASVIYAHPIIGILATLVAGGFCLWLALQRRSAALWQRLLVSAAPALGLMLSAPYWLVFVLMKEHVWVESTNTGYFDPVRHTVEWQQFFDRQWGFGVSVADSSKDTMPLQLGAAHFVLALGATVRAWRQPLAPIAAAAYLGLLFAMTPWGAWAWRLPVLEYTQFPWRALSITTGLQCLLFALAGPWFDTARAQWKRAAVAVLLVGGVALWQSDQFQIGKRIPDANALVTQELAHATEKFLTYNGKDEFRPKTTKVRPAKPRADRPLFETGVGTFVFQGTSRHHLRARLITSTDTLVTINQLYLPGWIVTLNGHRLEDSVLRANLLRDGRMQVPVRITQPGRPEEFSITASYAAPPGEIGGTLLALLAVLALFAPQIAVLVRRLRDRLRQR